MWLWVSLSLKGVATGCFLTFPREWTLPGKSTSYSSMLRIGVRLKRGGFNRLITSNSLHHSKST